MQTLFDALDAVGWWLLNLPFQILAFGWEHLVGCGLVAFGTIAVLAIIAERREGYHYQHCPQRMNIVDGQPCWRCVHYLGVPGQETWG